MVILLVSITYVYYKADRPPWIGEETSCYEEKFAPFIDI